MEQHIFEGRWEDLMLQASELAGKRVRITVIEGEEEMRPNEGMLAVLQRAKERAKETPLSGSTEESIKILRGGPAGKMFGYDPVE
jgi:hypothetical protein